MRKYMILCLILLFLLGLALTACQKKPAETSAETPDPSGEYGKDGKKESVISGIGPAAPLQDNARVFYEIFVGAFSDSDGDGIGDLRGIINRMDYLNDGDPDSGLSLGIEGIWLTPIFVSPSYHKYDVTDYYRIDAQFGSPEDLKELIRLCHERNVLLILDLPLNHTGRGNAWFEAFRQAHEKEDEADPYYDFYTYYREGEAAPEDRRFAKLAGTDVWYECNFSEDMPELNFENPAVRQELLKIAKYYLSLGADGFRFDAAKYPYLGNNEKNVEFWTWYMDELRKIKPDIYAVAEVWDDDNVTDAFYAAVDCFNFTGAQAEGLIAAAVRDGEIGPYLSYLEQYLDTIREARPDSLLHSFIANHDTDRAAGYLTPQSGNMQMAANFYLLSPGSPFIYYGEEIGMKGSRGGAHTDANRRLAMLWGDGDTVKDPVGSDYDAAAQTGGTLQDQLDRPDSLYSYYKRLLMIRRANPAIARGRFTSIELSGSAGAFLCEYDGQTVCVLHNTGPSEISVPLSDLSAGLNFGSVNAVIGAGTDAFARLDGDKLTLSPQTSAVLWPKN